MHWLPSPSGIRQVAQEYQHSYASRLRWARISGGALLLTGAILLLMAAALFAKIMGRASLDDIAPYAGATLYLLALMWCLTRAYAYSRASVQQARARLAQVERVLRNAAAPPADIE